MNDKSFEEKIEAAIGNGIVSQTIVDIANEKSVSLQTIAALLEKKVDVDQVRQWLQDGVELDSAAILIGQEIASPVVAQLVKNHADLRDITTNSQILLDGGVKVDLISGWLKNGTHLNNAIAIMDQGVDLNLIGTSSSVEDFTGLTDATVDEVVSRIPEDAKIGRWVAELGKIEKGMGFKWKDASGKTWVVRMHEADPQAPAGAHAASGWVLRVMRSGKYMDADGNFYTQNALANPCSTNYDPSSANATHMPIWAPAL